MVPGYVYSDFVRTGFVSLTELRLCHDHLLFLGCQSKTAPEGYVCDVIESNVDIFYMSGTGQDPTDDQKQDMHNLLAETIIRQANVGAFGDLGSVESVDIQDGTDNGGMNYVAIILGVLAAVLIAGLAYWYCFLRHVDEDSNDANPKGQHNGDTSDEDHSDEEDDKKRDIPVATVVAVEQIDAKSPESKKKEGWW
jgi:hypothetical protein